MRLIALRANHAGFKTVTFRQTGLSLIVGTRTYPDKASADERSYNGVGKSLLVEIVHFCLGSSKNAAFQTHLPDWEFSLDFSIGDDTFTVRRATQKQAQIWLNGSAYRLSDFNELIGKRLFDLPELAVKNLSFRSLLPRFIRRGLDDYNAPTKTASDHEDYTVLLRNLFLLGLEIGLVERKHALRTRQAEVEKFEKNFKEDPFIREYYTGNKDASLQTRHLEQQLARLEQDLAMFKVAEDFYDIELEANRLNNVLRELKNKKLVLENALHNIEKSMQVRPDIAREKILDLYGEMLAAFRDETLARLHDVEAFHSQLIENRIARLSQERLKLDAELGLVSHAITQTGTELNHKLAYLSDKRALDQYVTVSNERGEIQGKLQKLRDYQHMLDKSQSDLVHIRKDLAEETIKTHQYLAAAEPEIQRQFGLFDDFAKQFYPNAPAGITLHNNVGENKVRYDFDVRIEADSSDGINSVKIFCYDLAVLLLGCNHHMDFIWHDSRLYSDIDPKQRATLFKIAREKTLQYGKQYIASVNHDQLEAMRAEMTPDEFAVLFEQDTVVLRLKDDGDKSKLLGMQVDMKY
jgi:uncharacterized protein YydD (DUF2326 family)